MSAQKRRTTQELKKFDIVGNILNEQKARNQLTKKKETTYTQPEEKPIPTFTKPPTERFTNKSSEKTHSILAAEEIKSYPYLFGLIKSKENITIETLSQMNSYEITTQSEEALVKEILKKLTDALLTYQLSKFPSEIVDILKQRKILNEKNEII